MLTADAEGDEGRRSLERDRLSPVVAGQAARNEAAAMLSGPFVCRNCALDLVERMVRASVEVVEQEIERQMKEKLQCPN